MPTKPTIHVIAACTDRKRHRTDSDARLGTVVSSNAPLSAVVSAWWEILAAREGRFSAREVYAGDHWQAVLSLAKRTSGHNISLWVASAGYGLLPVDAQINAYGATFSDGHPDSVLRFASGATPVELLLQDWWNSIAQHTIPNNSAPRTVTAIATADPQASILIIAGPRYLQAMHQDLVGAVGYLNEPSRLVIVSSASTGLGPLEQHLVPSGAKLQGKNGLPGARTSLHARVSAQILDGLRGPLNAAQARAEYMRRLDETPDLPLNLRSTATDEEVREFIREEVVLTSSPSHTALLRKWRDGGRRCEQSRFRDLFREVRVSAKETQSAP